MLLSCQWEGKPVSGLTLDLILYLHQFNEQQRMVYNAVLAAVRAVESTMKAGVAWPDMHRLALRVLPGRRVERWPKQAVADYM